jgi:hypothetical protein
MRKSVKIPMVRRRVSFATLAVVAAGAYLAYKFRTKIMAMFSGLGKSTAQ